jgi:hypothetical protein
VNYLPEWWGENAIKDEVAKYFPRCPFCLEKTVKGHRDNWNALDTATCSSCGAEWHLYHSLVTEKMQWAELKKTGSKGGADLVGIKHKPEFWRKMFLDNLKQRGKPVEEDAKKTVTSETVKEKEADVKLRRCPYCRTLYDENLNTCPNCGSLAVKQLLKRCADKLENVKKRIHD